MKLIPLDAVLAEINRLIAELVEKGENTMFEQGRISAFEDAKLFLDTLEVKEVELEEEMDKEWNKCEPIDEGMGLEIASIVQEQFDNIAKHFFELGLKAQKGEV